MIKNKKPKQGISRLLEITEKEKGKVVFSLLMTAMSAFLKVAQFFFIYQIIAELVVKNLKIDLLNFYAMRSYAWLLIGTGVLYSILRYFASRFAHTAAFSVIHELRVKLVKHLNKIPIGCFNEITLGQLDKIILTDTERIEGFIAHHQADFVESVLMMPLLVLYLFTVNPILTLLAVLPLLLAIFILGISMSHPENKKDQVVMHNRLATMQTEVLEYIEGMNDIKCYDIGKRAMEKYRKAIEGLSAIIMKINKKFAQTIGFYYALLGASLMTIFPFVIYKYQTNTIDVVFLSEYILFVMVVPLFKDYLEKFFTMGGSMREINEGVKRIDEILHLPILEEPKMTEIPQNFDLHFENVSFAYNKKTVIDNMSFSIPEGKKLAIVGWSGGGKTTIAKLLLKFISPDKGKIYIGQTPLSEISSDELMKQIAFVFQESYLFQDTIWFNLTMGKDIEKENVISICKDLNLHEKIMSLEKGYQTVVGKDEGFFSGGETQRLAVARVLLKDSKVIVLDEATASSDTENERDLQKAFQKLAGNKTVVMIAHRLKTIRKADKILLVENGKIIEQGTHRELMLLEGQYYKLNKLASESEKLSIYEGSLPC